MTAPVVTRLTRNMTEATVNNMPYVVELRGKTEPRIKAARVVADGHVSARVQVPVVDGKPLAAPSTMDAIARRILGPSARVYGGTESRGAFKLRLYSARS